MRDRASLHAHARKRALERYGLVINRDDIRQAIMQIREHTAILEEKLSLTRAVYKVVVKGVTVRVVYNKKWKAIASFLPFEDSKMYLKQMLIEEEFTNPEFTND